MDVGFIGLGYMGAGMAANLVRAGHRVTVYNRTPRRARSLIEQGARAATRVRDTCGGDAVITMVADDASVEAVVFGDDGMAKDIRLGLAAADGLRVPMPLLLHDRLLTLLARGGEALDWSAIGQLAARDAGL